MATFERTRMKTFFRSTLLLTLFLLLAVGCEERPVMDASVPEGSDEALQTYQLRGTIVSRNADANSLTIDHEAIGDWMGAMTMSFPVRGANVDDLPPDGSAISATVNVSGTDYWVSDIKGGGAMPVPENGTPTDTARTTGDVSDR